MGIPEVVFAFAAIGVVAILYTLISVTGVGLLGAGVMIVAYGVYRGVVKS